MDCRAGAFEHLHRLQKLTEHLQRLQTLLGIDPCRQRPRPRGTDGLHEVVVLPRAGGACGGRGGPEGRALAANLAAICT